MTPRDIKVENITLLKFKEGTLPSKTIIFEDGEDMIINN
jgi:hypothetical protein